MSNDVNRLQRVFTVFKPVDKESGMLGSETGAPNSWKDVVSISFIPGSSRFNLSSISFCRSGGVLTKNTSHFVGFSVSPDSSENAIIFQDHPG